MSSIYLLKCDKCGSQFWTSTGVCEKCHGPVVGLMAHIIGMKPLPAKKRRARKKVSK